MDPVAPDLLSEQAPPPRRRPWLAGVLSLLVPGLGQVYARQTKRGFILLAASWAIMFGFVELGMNVPFPVLNVVLLVASDYGFRLWIVVDAVQQAKRQMPRMPPSRNDLYIGVTIVLIAILISFLDDALFKSYKMPSGSMIPRVLIGDYLIVDKLAYGLINPATDELLYTWGAPKRGDLAVFKYPEDPSKIFIKRIVGLPGESVEIRNKDVSINGMHLNEVAYTQYVDPGVIDRKQNPRDNFGPFTIPANNYFMLGDNRDQSLDSRFFGPVDRNAILGKVKIVYWSWKDGRVRWSRIGMILG